MVRCDLVEQPLGKESGIPIGIVVQTVPNGSLKSKKTRVQKLTKTICTTYRKFESKLLKLKTYVNRLLDEHFGASRDPPHPDLRTENSLSEKYWH